VRTPFTAVSPSTQQSKGVDSGPDRPMSAAEMHESMDRARSYALLWLLMRDQIRKQVNRFEKDRRDPPNALTDSSRGFASPKRQN
jgi:hypothetical protein